VLIFLGFAGEGFKQSETLMLKPGQQTTVGGFTVRLDAVKVSDDGRKQAVTAHTTIFRDGEEIGKMYPAKWFFRKHEDQPTTEVAIRRGFGEDLYIVLAAFEVDQQSASVEIVVNPLVNWVWVGFGIMALGTGIALLPEQAIAFAAAKVPAGAATASMMLLAALLTPAAAGAQAGQQVQPPERSALQRQLESEIMCTCGCRRPLNNCGMMNCHGLDSQTAKIKEHIAEGKDHDAILASFVQEFGGEYILAAPRDQSYYPLAWVVPYAVGLLGLLTIAFMARRWSHAAPRPAAAEGIDPEVNDRLDDELRNLD
jgi:cytochrome c-type biogenesis protein CcmF